MRKLVLFSVAVLLVKGSDSIPVLDEISDLKNVIAFGSDIRSALNGSDPSGLLVEGPSAEDLIKVVIQDIKAISVKLDKMEAHLSNKMDGMVQTLIRRLRLVGKLDSALDELAGYISDVDRLYQNFLRFTNAEYDYEEDTIKNFVNIVTSPAPLHLPDIIHKMYQLLVPGRTRHIKESLLTLIQKESLESKLEICNDDLSPQQRLLEMFVTIMLTEIKSYAILNYGYVMLGTYDNKKYKAEMLQAKDEYEDREKGYAKEVQIALANSLRHLRRCDPVDHVRNETYIEFEGLHSAFIINEAEMRPSGCGSTCEEITDPTFGRCDTDFCREKHACYYTMKDCKTIGGNVEVCLDNDYPRRYLWFKDNAGAVYGDNSAGCPTGKTKSLASWVNWSLYNCEYCLCTCTVSGLKQNVVGYISIYEQLSNVKNNKVVTGIQFGVQEGVVYFQIKQGTLSGDAKVSDESWKKKLGFEVAAEKKKDRNRKMLTVEPKTKVDLDDIIVPPNYAVTGVRMARNKDGIVDFHLEVHATPFDYATGKLDVDKGQWFTPDDVKEKSRYYKHKRTQLQLSQPDSSIKSTLNLIDSHPNQFMQFTVSNMHIDAGRTTVPVLDAQPLRTKPGFPLSGIGLVHTGATGYGGFIAPRIFTFDMSNHLTNRDELKLKMNLNDLNVIQI